MKCAPRINGAETDRYQLPSNVAYLQVNQFLLQAYASTRIARCRREVSRWDKVDRVPTDSINGSSGIEERRQAPV